MRGWLSRCISSSYDFLHVLASGVPRISTTDTLEHCTIMRLKSLNYAHQKKGVAILELNQTSHYGAMSLLHKLMIR